MPDRTNTLLRLSRTDLRSCKKRFGTLIASFFISTVLLGCAAQMAYRDGKDLLAHDNVEAGLAKFQEAIAHDPHNPEYKLAYLQTRDRTLSAYLEQANRLAAAGKGSDAEKIYKRILGIDPNNAPARAGLHNLSLDKRHGQLLKDAETDLNKKEFESARLKLSAVLTENPNNEQARTLQRAINEKTAKPPVETLLSAAYRKPITIEFTNVALKQVFEVISRTSGLNFLFDKDVKTDQKTSIFLKNSTVESVIYFALLTNQLELQVMDANTILVYPNTAAKLKDYQEMVIKSFFLTNADAKSVANTLKAILKTRDIVVDEKLNMVIMRDSPEAVRLAEKLVALHDVPEPEVMLEVEILEIKRSRLMELGIQWPDSLTLTPLPSAAGGTLTVRDLRTNLNGSTIGAGITPVTLHARKEDADGNILANPRIRARNHEKAKILIGERVPNITTTLGTGASAFISESINYVDVGLKLEVEPTIYLDDDVAIRIGLEVSNIVSQLQTKSGSVAYQIGTRNASTVLRLKDGENQVLAGLINDEDRRSARKVPGFGDIPVLGRLFGSTLDDGQKTEIVLSITPRLVRNIRRPEAALSEFRAGTESSFHPRPEGASQPALAAPKPAALPAIAPAPPPNHPAPALNGDADNSKGSVGTDKENAAASSNGAQLSWLGSGLPKAGETFAVRLMAQSNQPIAGLPITIGFNNQLLEVVGIAEGDFLKQGGAKTSFSSDVDPKGQIRIRGTRSGSGGATAFGSVATLNFRAIRPVHVSAIQVLTAAPTDATGAPVTVQQADPYRMQIRP